MTDDETEVPLDASPGDRIALAVARFGEADVADRAAALLTGHNEGTEFLLWVGGRHAKGILDGAPALYWPEVWGARTLLYAWVDSAASAIRDGLSNRAWRVREMCCRVVAARQLDLATELLPLLVDESPRVRANAARALGFVAEYEQAQRLKPLLKDPEMDVRRQAGASLRQLTERLDRSID
ncbi:MAG TPA: HEAT repeat domain-containing protein [Galbitalea sp.]|nr:HEAT repeat domain-containing protein [Galbitalea sp.]